MYGLGTRYFLIHMQPLPLRNSCNVNENSFNVHQQFYILNMTQFYIPHSIGTYFQHTPETDAPRLL